MQNSAQTNSSTSTNNGTMKTNKTLVTINKTTFGLIKTSKQTWTVKVGHLVIGRNFKKKSEAMAFATEWAANPNWKVKVVNAAIDSGKVEFPVTLKTQEQRRELLEYFSPIYKKMDIHHRVKLAISVKQAEKPVVEYVGFKELLESISAVSRAKVIVKSLEERKELISQYRPLYKTVGCFLEIEVKA